VRPPFKPTIRYDAAGPPVLADCQVVPPLLDHRTTYDVIGSPPVTTGGIQESAIDPVPVVART
jgi:hypothetical protein